MDNHSQLLMSSEQNNGEMFWCWSSLCSILIQQQFGAEPFHTAALLCAPWLSLRGKGMFPDEWYDVRGGLTLCINTSWEPVVGFPLGSLLLSDWPDTHPASCEGRGCVPAKCMLTCVCAYPTRGCIIGFARADEFGPRRVAGLRSPTAAASGSLGCYLVSSRRGRHGRRFGTS